MTRPQIQSVIPGCETPDELIQTPELTARVHAWLDAQEAQKRAALETRTAHGLMIAALTLANVKRYPYTDRSTGVKRYVTVAAEPKAKTIKAPTVKRKSAAQERREEKAAEKKARDAAEAVEHRKVSREAAERDLGRSLDKPAPDAEPLDPFAATRAALGDLA